ncbi:MAG: sigma 54-interacting transcriptional regulator [Panacagrimonas sp.]
MTRRVKTKVAHASPTGEGRELAAAAGDLATHLRFSPDAGHIQLFDQRMLLVHASSFAALRRELIDRLGQTKARELLMRLGYHQGTDDGRRIRALDTDLNEALRLGPRLREIEGFVHNQPIDAMRYDIEHGQFCGEYFWAASWEAQAHLQQVGLSGVPACWIMQGYADGYCTAVTGLPIHWREVECVAMGHAHCRVVGRPLVEWEDLPEDETRFLQIESFVGTPGRSRAPRLESKALSVGSAEGFENFVGASAGFNAAAQLVRKVAPTNSTVLFRGESGVGKECFARALHSISRRAAGPLVAINCAAIPPDLVEAELFGVEKGAYTGADRSRPGRFERADGGTLFLDEIASLSLPAQGKVLRALQEREIERVGGTQVRKVDVRVVAAANRDLRSEMEAGRFRQDLFYRLNVFPIEIPPLRDRPEDIPLLVSLFVKRYCARLEKEVAGLTPRAHDALWDYEWPGNVRELENMIERAMILAEPGGSIDVQHLFAGGEKLRLNSYSLGPRGALVPAAAGARESDARRQQLISEVLQVVPSLADLEGLMIEQAVAECAGNVSAAARRLRLGRGQMEYRLRKFRQSAAAH